MERVPIRRHQLAGLRTGADGYSPEQTELISELRRKSDNRFVLTQGESVICDICPLNPNSSRFDPDVGICDIDSPGLAELDREEVLID